MSHLNFWLFVARPRPPLAVLELNYLEPCRHCVPVLTNENSSSCTVLYVRDQWTEAAVIIDCQLEQFYAVFFVFIRLDLLMAAP
jgi:hypothetical protein